ncbi:MAG: hypothetical protein AB1Z23_06975 [Eubacteriales bacterium]
MEFEYSNKKARIIQNIIQYFLVSILILLNILTIVFRLHLVYILISLICTLFNVISVIKTSVNKILLSKIKIDDTGIEYISKMKRVAMQWEDISLIGMAKTPEKIRSRIIIFSTSSDQKVLCERINFDNISEDYIFCFYSKELFTEIKRYWQDVIIDERKIMDRNL